MASMDVKVTFVVTPEQLIMEEKEFKRWLLSMLREAINEEDQVVIQPSSNQALILRDAER